MNKPKFRTAQGPGKQDRLIQVLKVLVWPIALLVVLALFKETSVPKDIELSAKGIKISFYLLQAAERGGPAQEPPKSPPNPKEIQEVARKASDLSLDTARILWVDDNPENNQYEREALAALGIQFVLAKSTSEALPLLSSERFQLVITDFKRRDDERAGYTLLEEVKNLKNPPPVIIYSSSASRGFEEEAKKRGALAETNQPQRLFSLAIEAIVAQK